MAMSACALCGKLTDFMREKEEEGLRVARENLYKIFYDFCLRVF